MRSDTPKVKRQRLVAFVLFIVLGMFLYLGFLSTNYDLNGIAEARAVEQGGSSLFPPNHMLYRPLVGLIYTMLQTVGYRGRSILPAQVTTAVSGALGLGLFYWWLRSLVNREAILVITSLGFGTSWAYWVFSTDAFYIIPAATVILGGLILLSNILASPGPHPPITSLTGLGILCALTILLWQSNIFFLPVPLIGLFAKYKRHTRSLCTAVTVFVATVSVLVGCAYLFVGVFVLEHRTIPSFLEWLLRYGARLPIWGKWEVARLPKAATSFVSSLIPIWEGLGLRALLKGKLQPDKLLSQMSLVALALLLLLPPLKQLKRRSLRYGRKEEALDLLRQNISSIHQRGSKVYIVAVDTYSPKHLNWLASQTGLRQEDFQRFESVPAFVCDVVRFQELDGLR